MLVVDRLQKELDALPEDVQRALVVVAADRTGLVAPITAALATLGEADGALDRAEDSGVVVIDGATVRFRHALLRPLAYRLVAAPSRRAAYRALAASLTEPYQATERAWQLVSSSTAPDEEVAVLLELVAGAELRQGALTAAATAFEHAARLSPRAPDRTRRLVAATLAGTSMLSTSRRLIAQRSTPARGETRTPPSSSSRSSSGGTARRLRWGWTPRTLRCGPISSCSPANPARARTELRAPRWTDLGPLGASVEACLDPAAPLPPEPSGHAPLHRGPADGGWPPRVSEAWPCRHRPRSTSSSAPRWPPDGADDAPRRPTSWPRQPRSYRRHASG